MEDSSLPATVDKVSMHVNALTLRPVQLPTFWVQLEVRVARVVLDTGAQRSFLFEALVQKYFYYKTLQPEDIDALAVGQQQCKIAGTLNFSVFICVVFLENSFL